MIGMAAGIGGRAIAVELATPAERRTDAACAAQDGAADTASDGGRLASRLDRLRDDPGVLGRFDAR